MPVEELGARQLAALGRVGSRLESEDIAYWLFGGWAVDFYAGSMTRVHDDVDLAIWRKDLQRIAKLLESDGWRHAPAEDEDGGTGYEHGDVRLELTLLTRNDDGDVFIPLHNGPVPWAKESFADDVRELSGVRARHHAGVAEEHEVVASRGPRGCGQGSRRSRGTCKRVGWRRSLG